MPRHLRIEEDWPVSLPYTADHGNGIQEILWKDPNVLYISLHMCTAPIYMDLSVHLLTTDPRHPKSFYPVQPTPTLLLLPGIPSPSTRTSWVSWTRSGTRRGWASTSTSPGPRQRQPMQTTGNREGLPGSHDGSYHGESQGDPRDSSNFISLLR